MSRKILSKRATNSSEYGWNSGTGYSLTFKSGTNQLHGTLFEYFRNTTLDARNWFGRTRDVNKQNDFGGVVGGPVILPKIYNGKDRTFFFVSYDGFRFRQGAAGTTTTVPTAAMRTGDFRELLGPQIGTDVLGRPVFRGAIYDPRTTRSDGRGGFLRDAFAYNGQLNVIDPSRLSAISKFFQAGYPLPTRPGTQNNWVGLPPAVRTQTDMFKGKIDEVINSKHRFNFSWGNALRSSHLDRGDNGFGPLINPAQDNIESEYRYRFNYNWTIRPNLLLELSSGIVRTPDRDSPPTYPEQRTGGAAAGLKGTISHYTPITSIETWTGFGISATQSRSIDQGNSANASLTWIKGAHVLKFGAQFQFVELYRIGDGGTGGSFNFRYLETSLPGQNTTGAGYASFVLGEVNSATLSSFNQFNRSMQGGWGFFAQDQWRVTPKLTLNYGLRWNLFVPSRIGGDAIGTFDPTLPNPGAGGRLGALTFWGNGPGRNGLIRLYEYYYRAFEPRLGFAYQLAPKTVIRAFYGLTSPAHFGSFTSGFNAPTAGWSASVTPASLDNGVTPAFNWDNGFPLTIPPLPRLDPSLQNGSGAAYVDRKDSAKPGRIQNLNFGVERELPGQTALRLDYVGTLAHALPTAGLIQLNQLPLSALSLGSLLLADINSPQAQAAGIPLPYSGFTGSVAQALRPYPQYQNVPQRGSATGFSLYHSLQVNLQKRVGEGLTLLVAYTLSKSLDNGEFGNQGWMSSNPLQHVSQLRTAKKLTNYDQPQALAISYTYELPFGPGKRFASGTTNPVLKQLVGGWEVAGVQNYFSGVPVVIATTASVPGGFAASGFGIWANRNLGVPIATGNGCSNLDPNDPARNRYLNINAFSTPAPFTLGNTAYLPSTRTCPYLNENFSIIKHFFVTERTKLEFGTYFFNAFNRHRWLGLQSNIGVAESFGRFTSASTPRQILLYGKINF
jgi:hypothetical protein